MFSLTSYKLTQNFWQQIFGGSSIEITTYKDIQAIITVKEDDLKGEPSEISKRLYIGESEVEALKAEYAAAKASERASYCSVSPPGKILRISRRV